MIYIIDFLVSPRFPKKMRNFEAVIWIVLWNIISIHFEYHFKIIHKELIIKVAQNTYTKYPFSYKYSDAISVLSSQHTTPKSLSM